MSKQYKSDVAIIGGGIAGIVTALELLPTGQTITLVDRDTPERFGGLAPSSFGGMALVDTPLQRKKGIKDSPELALKDWHSFAQFNADDHWPKRWAEYYVNHSVSDVYNWLIDKGVRFLPAVNWVERGLFTPGNSVPRYHVMWGTGHGLLTKLIRELHEHPQAKNLNLLHQHNVTKLTRTGEAITGCSGVSEVDDGAFEVQAQHTVVATGGITGNIEKVKENWHKPWGAPPEVILNGTHPCSDGRMHDEVQAQGGQVTHLDKMWNYAAGIPHPKPKFDGHGLSLIPCKSALWLNHRGERIGPDPLVTGFDTTYLCQRVAQQEKPYTWQLMNWRIAAKEFAISGAEHNPAIRDNQRFKFIKDLLLGSDDLVKQMQAESEDFIVADNLPSLVKAMNARAGTSDVDVDVIEKTIDEFDANFERGSKQYNDDQIRRVQHARAWFPDKLRTAKPAKLLDGSPLIAIKLNLISRKSLGGIVTDLDSRVLLDTTENAQPIDGLYAVGECTGFGGGGASGFRSLEGTFLAGCILTARRAARSMAE